MSDVRLRLVPVRSRQAKDFVRVWHRHHPPPAGQIFAVGAADETGTLRAVAIVGRPVARHLDDGATLEVTRTASDGTPNANSLLYGASWRASFAARDEDRQLIADAHQHSPQQVPSTSPVPAARRRV